jgi:hypothetical protein
LSFGIANATIPDDELSTVQPCDTFGGVVICPYAPGGAPSGTQFTVHAVNAQGQVIPDAFVELIFGTPGNHQFCTNVVLTGTTNANGDAVFNLSAGGCTVGANALRVKVNNTQIRAFSNAKSPDFDGVSPNGVVALGDFVYFAGNYGGGGGCTDFFNDGMTNLPDFVLFAACYAKACP